MTFTDAGVEALVGDEAGPAVPPGRFNDRGRWASPPAPWHADTPERALLSSEARERIRREIDRLPPRQAAVLILRDVEGLSSQEACNVLGLSETNQRVLLHRARSRLRGALEEYFRRD